MGRKYNQPGYQDTDRDRDRQQKPRNGSPRNHKSSDGPRSPRMPGFQEVMRCAMCGHLIQTATEITIESQCPNCQADLRSCKHCRHFDTGARLECTKPIPQRIMAKDKRNECTFFEARTSIERETKTPVSVSSASPSTPKDARSAFDDLFR